MSCLETTGSNEIPPPLTNSSTVIDEEESIDSLEEFPLQQSRIPSIAFPTISASTDDLGLKRAEDIPQRPKRLSLQAIKRPLLRVARGSSSNVIRKLTGKSKVTNDTVSNESTPIEREEEREELQIPIESNNQLNVVKKEERRVSFSPSTEEIVDQYVLQDHHEDNSAKKSSSKPLLKRMKSIKSSKPKPILKYKRSASFNDSIGIAKGNLIVQQRPPLRRRSLSIYGNGIHFSNKQFNSTNIESSSNEQNQMNDKSTPSKPKVARQQAMAARHARVLERIMNAGSSIELEEIKAKRIKKLGEQKVNSKTQIQQYPVVSPKKIKALKEALMNHDMAIGIIEELREMQVDSSIMTLTTNEIDSSNIKSKDEIQKETKATNALHDVIDHEEEKKLKQKISENRRKIRPKPIRAICLNFTETEIAQRQSQSVIPEPTQTEVEEGETSIVIEETGKDCVDAKREESISLAEASMMAIAITKVGNWFRSGGAPGQVNEVSVQSKSAVKDTIQFAYELADDVKNGDTNEALADTARLGAAGLSIAQPIAGSIAGSVEDKILPKNKVPQQTKVEGKKKDLGDFSTKVSNAFSGVSPISLITQPGTSLAAIGAKNSGVFDALADVSALAVQHEQGGLEAMQELHPPLDRMAIFVYWWGFELTMPEPSMQYLSTAHSVSGAFLGFLQTMVTTGGVPEMLPFIRYISSFVDMEFNAIRSQDRNQKGVVIAATWLMPLALIPRPWDYAYDEPSKKPVFKPIPPTTKPDQPEEDSNPFSSIPPAFRYVPPVSPRKQQTLSPIPVGGLPFLPVRISSTSTPISATTSTVVFGTKVPLEKKVTSTSKQNQISSQERHFNQGQSAAINSALSESPILRARVMESSISGSNVLSSLEEVPEGSVRVK